MKKTYLNKIRNKAAIIEVIGSIFIFNIVYFIFYYARRDGDGGIDPNITQCETLDPDLLIFFAMLKNPSLVVRPDNNNTHSLMDPLINFIKKNISLEVKYVNNSDEMYNFIYARDVNGLGIYWNNSDYDDCWENPIIQVYHQSFGPAPNAGIFRILRTTIAQKTKKMQIISLNTSLQAFASPSTTTLFDIRLPYTFFSLVPAIFATMDDFQTVLDEKDTKIAALTFLMGCPESAYWLVQYIVPFFLSLPAYALMGLMYCYVYMLLGTSYTLFLTLSLLFVSAQIWFQLFITTFMKKGKSGRTTTVAILVFIYFFGFLHMFVTLDPNNHSNTIKHLVSIIPFSSYQMSIMTLYTQCREAMPPITWSNMYGNHTYNMWWGVLWLIADNFIFMVLFIIFNATNPREFGTPAIPWSKLFSFKAWAHFTKKHFNQLMLRSRDSKNSIVVEGLSKTYFGFKEVPALKEASFAIKPGEVIIVVGPNGAGKSTLMNCLSGTILPSTGTLSLFDGEPTSQFRDIQEILGICFQDNVLFERITVQEHFEIFGAFRGISNEDIISSLEFFAKTLQLEDKLNTRAGDLSGGQKRKLCIGLTLLGQPPIVIMDEPTAGVDVQARHLIWQTISSLRNTTTIITSHALEEAEAVSSRLFIVSAGKLVFAGTSTELRKQFKCGYLLRIDSHSPQTIENVLSLAKEYVPESHIHGDREDIISMPVSSEIPKFLVELKARKAGLGIQSYSFSVEHLEDMLMKLVQSEESLIQFH